jgi:TolB-like protein
VIRRLLSVCAALLCLSSLGHADPLKGVAKELAKGITKIPGNRVAVLLFPYENGDLSTGSSLVSEQLMSRLAQRSHIQVIERSQLASVLSEVRLEESGVTGSTAPTKAGEIQGVDALVTGTLTDLPDDVTVVNARMVRFPSGEILAADTVEVERTWDDPPHTPPPLQGEPAHEEPYVLNASPLIFTPTARRGPPPSQAAEGMMASASGGGQSDAGWGASGTMGSGNGTLPPPLSATSISIVNRATRRHVPRVNDQVLYAMGVTMDVQGHHQLASHFYRDVVQKAPAESPLRARAASRIGRSSDSSH